MKRARRNWAPAFGLTLGLLFLPVLSLGAQTGPPPARGPVSAGQGGAQSAEARQQMMQRIQRDFERQMAREVGLSPEQMTQVRSVMGNHMPARGEIMRERHQIRIAMEALERSGAGEARARELLDRSRALRARELELQRAEEEALLQVISPTQLMRLHRFREGWAERIQRLEAEGRLRRGGRPPGGGAQEGPEAGASR